MRQDVWQETKRQFKDRRHRPVDLVLSLLSFSALVALSWYVQAVQVPEWEVAIFRAINGWPDWLFPIIWPFMQYGVFVTIPIAAAIAAYFKRYRLAILLLLGGIAIYFLALVVKEIVHRLRPVDILDMVQAREQVRPGSLGYPSGHLSVASTIATFTFRYLSKWWRFLSVFALLVVMVGRVYVSAHLPLDNIGGLFLGVFIASTINYVVGSPHQQRSEQSE